MAAQASSAGSTNANSKTRPVVVIGAAAFLCLLGILLGLALYVFGWKAGGGDLALEPLGDAYWEDLFLHRMEKAKGELLLFRDHDVHPTRGWTPKPNLRNRPHEFSETTNNRGQRSLNDYAPEPEKYTIVVVGDSFTYGSWADDADVWPTILQGLARRSHVINLAVGGYGIDQMYITLRETIDEFRPQLVVFALISDDLNRSMLSFREGRKPRFVVAPNGDLVLTNTPIGGMDDSFVFLREKLGRVTPRVSLLREDREVRQRIASGQWTQEQTALNTKIIAAAITCAVGHGSEFLLVHLASGRDLMAKKEDGFQPLGEEQFLAGVAQAHNAPFLATRKAFLEAEEHWTDAHYKGPEARFVARLVWDAIQQRPSWKAFYGH